MSASIDKATPALFRPASVKPNPTPVVPALSSLPISTPQVKKALTALLAHVSKVQEKRNEEDLLGEQEEKVLLVVGLKRPAKREVHMPTRFPLAHPLIDPRQSPVVLFVKDPQRQYKDLLEKSKISFVSRVVGLQKLRTKHKTFEAKRALLKEGELFLVDDRVVVDVGKSLGKMWREAKKQPVPIAIGRKDLKAELERAVSATYLQINTGSSLSIKFGSTSVHSPEQLLDNLLSLIPQLAVKMPNEGWSNIASLHIKTSTSISLPIYNTTLDDEGMFAAPSAAEDAAKVAAAEKKAAKALEQAAREESREQRRRERSAVKEGVGRAASVEKKRKAPSEEVVESLSVDKPILEESDQLEKPRKKKSKQADFLEEIDEDVPAPKPKKAKKVPADEVALAQEGSPQVKAKKVKKVKA